MKNKLIIISILLTGFVSILSNNTIAAIKGGKEKVVIQTSAQCGSCQQRIENGLKIIDGIKSVDLNLDNKKLIVVFNPKLISIEQIKNSISSIGYDADEVKANGDAYNNLPKCCQKNGHE